ncbi:hypothetical protein RND81_04G185600 [Saponaria officinalis]|uniref:NTF2-like domain-containing protein n=1 Tax=Saponaria officinalis TaxID=3572 RepID=A0AAW1LNA0_SAPOF
MKILQNLALITQLNHISSSPRNLYLLSAASLSSSGIMDQASQNENRSSDSGDLNSSKGSKLYSDNIIPRLLNLYGERPRARDFEIYADNATFEDPLMCAHGVKQIKSAFYTIPKVFSESGIVEYTVKEEIISPGKNEIFIDNKQHYKFWGRNIDMISLIVLSVEDGKVVRHEDRWDKKPLRNRENLPVLGRLLEMSRRGSMLATHVIMGFGKDPFS